MMAFSHCKTHAVIISSSLLGFPCSFTCVNRSRIFAKFAFTTIHSSAVIPFRFVFLLVRSEIALLGDLSLDCAALSLRSAEPDDKGSGALMLVGVAFVNIQFAVVAFARLADAFSLLCALEDFASITFVCRTVVVGLGRGVLTALAVGFATRGRYQQFTCYTGSQIRGPRPLEPFP